MSHIKANPIRWLWDQAQRVYQRFRGDTLGEVVAPTPDLRDRFVTAEEASGWLFGLNGSLVSGDVSIQRWVLDFRSRLKDTYISEYVLARGGREMMTPQDWGRLGRMLRDQYAYLNGFAEDIASGKLSKAQIDARGKMYFQSSRQAYERGAAASRGMPSLPAYPGDGSTVCRTNCQCHWDIQDTEDAWLATWVLGEAEHCPDCVERSQNWAPLRLSK